MRLADLHRSVETTLASKRLGTPVFVRYLLQSQDKAGAVLTRLTNITGAIRAWIGQPVERVYAQGQVKTRQLALTIEFRGGGTALLGWSAGPGDVDLMVLGNRGAMVHDAGADSLDLADGSGKPDAGLLALIERAVRSGRPEVASK